MKNDFILPKNWYVLVNKTNIDILSKWRYNDDTTKLYLSHLVGITKCANGRFEKGQNPFNKPKDLDGAFWYDFGNEITFDQFREYVLGETIEPIIEDFSYLEKLFKELNIT